MPWYFPKQPSPRVWNAVTSQRVQLSLLAKLWRSFTMCCGALKSLVNERRCRRNRRRPQRGATAPDVSKAASGRRSARARGTGCPRNGKCTGLPTRGDSPALRKPGQKIRKRITGRKTHGAFQGCRCAPDIGDKKLCQPMPASSFFRRVRRLPNREFY